MKEKSILLKIWTDPVWSKVISAGIIVGSTFLLKNIFPKFIEDYFQELIVSILLFISIIMIINIFLRLNKNRPNIKWLRKMMREYMDDYIFLLWFPIHKKKINPKSYIMSLGDNFSNIFSLIIIQKLRDHNILKLNGYGIFEINTKAYNCLEKLYQGLDKNNDFIDFVKNSSLEELILGNKYKSTKM